MTTVVVADDQELVRSGLVSLVGTTDDLVVVGEAGQGEEAVRVVRRERPDVVLMDVRMPVLDGIEATRQIVAGCPGTRVLVLTTFGVDEYVYAALRAGASGFLMKDVTPEDLLDGIRLVAAGEALLAPSLTGVLVRAFASGAARPKRTLPELTGREQDVLLAVARGLSNAEIAASCGVAVTTVKTYVSRLLLKLGGTDRVHLVIAAYDAGLVG